MQNISWNSKNITNLADPVNNQDAATKNYVDSRKHLITVWSEQKGSLTAGANEWSFGNGADGMNNGRSGYPMLSSGRALRMGIAASSENAAGAVAISATVNGVQKTNFHVQKPSGTYSAVKVFDTPLELSQGDRLNFRTNHDSREVICAVVNVLIELDL